MDIFKDIIKQICGILQSSLEEYSFCHNDLFAWNIMLTKWNDDESRVYKTKSGGEWTSTSPLKVVIIDLGKSHAIYKKLHHGFIKPFQTSTIQDIIIFIISCSSILLTKHCCKTTLSFIFTIMSFLSQESKYCPKLSNTRYLREFISKAKKYTEIMYSDKGILEKLYPIDFIIFLKYQKPIKNHSICNTTTLYLPEDVFDDPNHIISIMQNIDTYSNDENKFTFLVISKILTFMNLKYFPSNKKYLELSNYLVKYKK